MSMHTSFTPDVMKITINGDIDSDLALQMRSTLTAAHSYWDYDEVELEINSDGGDMHAMHCILDEIHAWRKAHGIVTTHGTLRSTSAAAVLLSMGDVGKRSAQRSTLILFHCGRLSASKEQAFTATNATAAARRLNQADAAVFNALSNHLASSRGSIESVSVHGLARCKEYALHQDEIEAILRGLNDLNSSAINGRKRKLPLPKWHKQVESMYKKTMQHKSMSAYRDVLEQLFQLDAQMPLSLAWCMQLIDSVEHVPFLQALDADAIKVSSPISGSDQKFQQKSLDLT